MKTTFCIITALMLLTPPKARAMFGHTAEERQRRIAVEQQLAQERQRLDAQQRSNVEQQRLTNRWQTTASILGIVAILMLIAGTAIGSRGRYHAATGK